MGLDCYLWIYDQRTRQIRVETQLDRLHHLDPVLEHLHGPNFGISQEEAAPFVTVAQMRTALCEAPLSTRDLPRQMFWRMEVWRLLHGYDELLCTISGQYWRFDHPVNAVNQVNPVNHVLHNPPTTPQDRHRIANNQSLQSSPSGACPDQSCPTCCDAK